MGFSKRNLLFEKGSSFSGAFAVGFFGRVTLDLGLEPDLISVRYGVLRGPCNATLDGPKDVRAENPHGFVKYYNIKYGEIGSTFSGSTRRLNEPIHT